MSHTSVDADRLARWLSPTLGIGFVDLALGLELAFASGPNYSNSGFVTASGGRIPASLILIAFGVATIVATLRGSERARRNAVLANVIFWTYITATLVQRSADTGTLLGPTLTGGYALTSFLRFLQLKGLRRDRRD